MTRTAIVWFRRDLRVHDHPALAAAVAQADVVVPLFVFDEALLAGRWPSPNRVWFMRESVAELGRALAERGAGLRILRGRPVDVVPAFAREVGATDLHLTRDATPYGRTRDRRVEERLTGSGVAGPGVAGPGVRVHVHPGLYVHEPDEVLTRDGRPFSVYGPYRRAWEALPRRALLPAPEHIPGPSAPAPDPVPAVASPTADPALMPVPGEAAARERLARWLGAGIAAPVDRYADTRNRLGADGGTSRLSQDLRFGLLSPLEVLELAERTDPVAAAVPVDLAAPVAPAVPVAPAAPVVPADPAERGGEGRRAFVAELAWREFYAHVLWHHPRVAHEPFQSSLADLPFHDDPVAFEAWREGRTGYPVVDAAMRQLRATGFVHNRARMVAASFLAKHLLLDYRLGEAEFMRHLTDGDLASNNGGWQWTASTGTDPQPSFRVFNPVLQGSRFDPDGAYVRRWVPELANVPTAHIHKPWTMEAAEQAAAGCRIGVEYPAPIVDHAEARERALAVYRATKAAAARG